MIIEIDGNKFLPQTMKECLIKEQAYNEGYNDGYSECNEKLHAVMAEREDELQKLSFNDGYQSGKKEGYLEGKSESNSGIGIGHLLGEAFDEGFLAAVQEMTECDCPDEYSEYEFGDVGDSDDWHDNSQKTKYNLIGIHGLAHSGKDLAGKVLLQELGEDWQRGAFADIPKKMLNVMGVDTGDNYKDGVDGYYDVSFRKMIQTLGTGWGRDMLDKDIWIKAFTKINTPNNYIMTDVRMENEADWIRGNGGVIIHIKGRGGIDSNHESEKGIEIKREDVILFNDKDEESFIQEVKELTKNLNVKQLTKGFEESR